MLLATFVLASQAVTKDIGLIATFGGIGVIVNVILVFIAVQVRGERRQNQEYMDSRRRPPA
jgi:ABC-type transporter Mla subunit MlaD